MGTLTPTPSTDTFTYDTDHARLTQVSTGNLVGTNTYITEPVMLDNAMLKDIASKKW